MNTEKIEFDNIHTKEKQKKLELKMREVAEEIHRTFPLKEKTEKCIVCNSNYRKYFTKKYGYIIDKCMNCGHLFTNPYPSIDSLDYYYNSPMKDFENKFFEESFEARLPIFYPRVDEIKKYINHNKTLLDVGSAIGIFIEAIYRRGNPFNIEACDLSKNACIQLEKKFPKLKVHNINIYDFKDKNKYYDAVSLWDTIEHITSPEVLLKNINSILVEKGYLFFSTPNTNSLEWKTMGEDHIQILPPGHVNLYNSKNISILLEKYNFEVVKILTLNPSLDISYILKKKKENIISRFEQVFFDLLLESDFNTIFIDYLIQKRLAGNMFVIARKKL